MSGFTQSQEVVGCAQRESEREGEGKEVQEGTENCEEQEVIRFSKIQGKAPYRKPRVGPDFQASIPDTKEVGEGGSS